MVDNVHHLRLAKKLTPVEEIRIEVVEILEKTLAEAKRGEIDEIVIMAKCPGSKNDGEEWIERASCTLHMRAWVGALELIKSNWIEAFQDFRIDEG